MNSKLVVAIFFSIITIYIPYIYIYTPYYSIGVSIFFSIITYNPHTTQNEPKICLQGPF